MSLPKRVEGSLLSAAAHAPFIDLSALAPGGLMIISPHPDDETLGCGMALACAAATGIPVCLVLLTDGEASHPRSQKFDQNQLIDLRRREFTAALAVLSPNHPPNIIRLRLPDGSTSGADLANGIVERVSTFAQENSVTSVWTTWRGDPHCDHETASLLGRRVAERIGSRLFEFAVWGRFGDRPIPPAVTVFSERSGKAKKRQAAGAYASQITGLISDDPTGFVMPPRFVEHFITSPEIFIHVQ